MVTPVTGLAKSKQGSDQYRHRMMSFAAARADLAVSPRRNEPTVSTLQNALNEAASGKTINWLGRPDTQREYIYVPDAMRIAAAIGALAEAFSGHWCLPGSGPLSGWQAA